MSKRHITWYEFVVVGPAGIRCARVGADTLRRAIRIAVSLANCGYPARVREDCPDGEQGREWHVTARKIRRVY